MHCSSTDAHSNTATGSFHVTVRGTFPPTVLVTVANPTLLAPADGRMVNVTVTVIATDLTDPHPASTITGVTSNQPNTGPGPDAVSPVR